MFGKIGSPPPPVPPPTLCGAKDKIPVKDVIPLMDTSSSSFELGDCEPPPPSYLNVNLNEQRVVKSDADADQADSFFTGSGINWTVKKCQNICRHRDKVMK